MRYGRYRFVTGFLVVPVAVYVFFMVWPYVQDVQLSFTRWNGLSSTPEYIGLDNYTRLLHDDMFLGAVLHNAFFLLTLPLITITLALFLAFLLNVGGRGNRAGEPACCDHCGSAGRVDGSARLPIAKRPAGGESTA